MTSTDALTLLFIGLKLAGIITWSWWLILMSQIVSIIVINIITAIASIKDGSANTHH